LWVARVVEAERNLEQGVALARRIGRPYLEFTGLAYQAVIECFRSYALAVERGRQAVELAEQHGWTDEPAAGLASVVVGGVLTWQGRLEEAETWIQRTERTLRAEAEPAVGLAIHHARGELEFARGRDADALAAFQAADRLAGRLAEPNVMVHASRSLLVRTLVRLGESERAEQILAALGEQDRDGAEIRIGVATLRLAPGDPPPAIPAPAPGPRGPAPTRRSRRSRRSWTAPHQWFRPGWLRRSCSRRSPGTRSVIPLPPQAPWSVRSTWPNPTGC